MRTVRESAFDIAKKVVERGEVENLRDFNALEDLICDSLRSFGAEVREECAKEAAKHNFTIGEIIRTSIEIK